MSQDWWPSTNLACLHARAEMLATIRDYFAEQQVLEVDTPSLSRAANTDLNIDSITANYYGPSALAEGPLYLHTSPEFPMKRLLASGSGAIYQVCKVFRDGEYGRYHNPEFSLLEWYRPGFDHHALIDEVDALINLILGPSSIALRKLTYQQAFINTVGFDPLINDSATFRSCAQQHGMNVVGMNDASHDEWLDLLMDQAVIPALGKGRLFIIDYPASQASLARLDPNDKRFAQRFELYIDGIELANGFYELTDAVLQRQRFEDDNKKRQYAAKPMMPIDNNFIDALEAGLPDCAGVALGLDRLLMLKTGASDIKQVLAFPFEKA